MDPLRIPEILDIVLRKVDSSVLRSSRLVNHQWNRIGSNILRSRDDQYIRIETTEEVMAFDACTLESESESTLFQCHNFKLNGMLPSQIEFQIFSTYHSVKIKRLIINVPAKIGDSQNISMQAFYSFLFHDIPQVEYLEIQSGDVWSVASPPPNTSEFSECWESTSAQSEEEFQLSNLKVFKMFFKPIFSCRFASFINAMIKTAKNMEELNVPFCFDKRNSAGILQGLINSGRTHLIKEITLDSRSGYWRNIELLEKLAESNMKIRVIHDLSFPFINLSIPQSHLWHQLESCLNKIFRFSCNTLESLSMNPIGFLQEFKLPSLMPKLKQLSLVVENYNIGSILGQKFERVETKLFPEPVNFSQKLFPKLKEVNVVWQGTVKKNHEWKDTFGECINIFGNSVEILSLQRVSSAGNWLQNLSKMFPNVKELKIDSLHLMDNFESFCRKMFVSFPKVEKILMNKICDSGMRKNGGYLDACLIGVPDMKFDEITNAKIEEFVKHPSIFNLKNLKFLNVTLGKDDQLNINRSFNQDGDNLIEIFVPELTKLFAETFNPNLEIEISVEHSK